MCVCVCVREREREKERESERVRERGRVSECERECMCACVRAYVQLSLVISVSPDHVLKNPTSQMLTIYTALLCVMCAGSSLSVPNERPAHSQDHLPPVPGISPDANGFNLSPALPAASLQHDELRANRSPSLTSLSSELPKLGRRGTASSSLRLPEPPKPWFC